jgi:hypothetical protein
MGSLMARKKISRFGIGEWFGQIYMRMDPELRSKYASLKSNNDIKCPYRNDIKLCNKSGGVCTLASYISDELGNVIYNEVSPDFVTLCPNRFWQNNKIFMEIGRTILNTDVPTLIKEVNFLQRVDFFGNIQKEYVGKIDLILTKVNSKNYIVDWCALEIQAVYFSGSSMSNEFAAIKKNPSKVLFPVKNRRPDFRSSGPKRLMPQLETKIPTLRRWGKKMSIVIDKPFFESIAPMKEVNSLSNADIAWFVVNYDNDSKELHIYKTIFTTLESSIEGLTAGKPISKESFEGELQEYLLGKENKLIKLFN